MIFLTVILPVLLIFLSGYVLQRRFRLDLKPISTLAMYILSPALVFRTFYTTDLNDQLLYTVIICLLLMFGLILITSWSAKIFRYDQKQESALMLTTAFMNSGNYGAPIVLFAFGSVGFDYSIPFMVIQSILMSVFGIYYASRGQAGIGEALKTVLKMPANYAVIVAITLQLLHVHMAPSFFQAIDLIADAAIPTIMLVLGMQLANVNLKNMEWSGLTLASVIRLVISPLLAYLICLLFPLDPLLQKVIIVSAAMPAAATTVMYAIQFDAKPQFVSSCALITTLASFATLTLLLSILQ